METFEVGTRVRYKKYPESVGEVKAFYPAGSIPHQPDAPDCYWVHCPGDLYVTYRPVKLTEEQWESV